MVERQQQVSGVSGALEDRGCLSVGFYCCDETP